MNEQLYYECAATITASRWRITMALLFGEGTTCTSDGYKVTVYTYKGVRYITGFERSY